MKNFENAVQDLFDHYHAKVISSPNLYAYKGCVKVVLPKSLLEYSNASAGHSGFGAGARPVGIARKSSNGFAEIKKIFESVESLTAFILSSECNGREYVAKIVESHRQKGLGIDDRFLNDQKVWVEIYKKHNVPSLGKIFGSAIIIEAKKILTVNEFELRFGL